MKRAMQNADGEVVVIRRLDVKEDRGNGYYEQLAIGYNTKTDGLELVILSCGNGKSDDRVLADQDEGETLSTATMIEAIAEISKLVFSEEYADISNDLRDLIDYIDDQVYFHESILENE
mgnify:CR=1 FL=1